MADTLSRHWGDGKHVSYITDISVTICFLGGRVVIPRPIYEGVSKIFRAESTTK
jgi:hypothetical protein